MSVTFCLLVRQELQCVDQVVTYFVWRGMRPKHLRIAAIRTILYDKDSVWIPPDVLASACSTPSVALLLLLLLDVAVPDETHQM